MQKGELMKLIGKNVRYYRIERKMTQDELSNIIGKIRLRLLVLKADSE